MKKTKISQSKKLEKYLTKFWPIMASIVAILFFTAGVVMTTIDNKYIKSVQYLITVLILVISINQLTDKSFKIKKQTELKFFLFNTGFILAVIGLEVHAAMWIIGMLLITVGLCKEK